MSQRRPLEVTPRSNAFRRAVLRGLGVVMPPLLTIVIFLWVGRTVQDYVLTPVSHGVRNTLASGMARGVPEELSGPRPTVDGATYVRLPSGSYVPVNVYNVVNANPGDNRVVQTTVGFYRRYVEVRYLQPWVVIPVTLFAFILVLYLLGKFLAAGIGRVFWNLFEQGIVRLPLIRNVYSSVKQVTDFVFNESEIQYTRVVGVEYPRKGIWAIAFVTSEGLIDVSDAAGEPILTLLLPSSPMPVTGWTVMVRKSEVIDLEMTIDQAFQFIVSCGVVVPPQQLTTTYDTEERRLASASGG